MSDDEKPLDLRDQIAISVLNGMFSGLPNSNGPATGLHSVIKEYYQVFDQKPDAQDNWQKEYYHERMERICKFAYHVADIMRKARLKAFE